MTQELVTWQPTPEDDGGLGLDPKKDLRLEFVQINGQLGIFTFGRDRTQGPKSTTLVLLSKLPATRALFQQGKLGDPVCSSDNGIMPINTEQAKKIGAGPTCASCKYGQWLGKQKPPCGENLNLLAASPPTDADAEPFPFLLRLRGTSIPVMQELFTKLERQRHSVKPVLPVFAYVIELSNERIANADRGQNYFRLTAKIISQTDPAHWAMYAGLRDMYRQRASDVLSVSSEAERQSSIAEQAVAGPIPIQAATQPQINFIVTLLERIGLSNSAFLRITNGVALDVMTRQQASDAINTLKQIELQRSAEAAKLIPNINAGPVGVPDDLPFGDEDSEENLESLAATAPAETNTALQQMGATPINETLTLSYTDSPVAKADTADSFKPPLPTFEKQPAPAVKNLTEVPINAEQLSAIQQLAKDQLITEPDLHRWCRAQFGTPDPGELTAVQADAWIEKLQARAANIAASQQAQRIQQTVAATATSATATAAQAMQAAALAGDPATPARGRGRPRNEA